MTNISYVDWFLLSKLFLKRILSSPLRVNMTNHNNTRWRVTEGDISKLIEFSKKKVVCIHQAQLFNSIKFITRKIIVQFSFIYGIYLEKVFSFSSIQPN